MARLTEAELKKLVKGGETSTVELKLAAPRTIDLAERLCGMANARGGIVIIWVEDANRKMVGVPDERVGETMDVILRAAWQVIKPELILDPPEPEVYVLAGKKLIVVTIAPTDGPVYQAGGIFWIRQGTQTRALTMTELSEMMYDRGLRDWELEPAYNATMDDLDLDQVNAFIAMRSSASRQSTRFKNTESVLVGMRCAVKGRDGKIVPTNAGMLFFGHAPQEHIPQSEVVCVLFREAVGASRYADRKIVTGRLQEVIDDTEAFLNRYIAVGARVEGWKRIDIPEYSIEVLREAVINAVVHRDYSKRGERVRVFYYLDRVEVHSPGVLLPGISVEQMQRGEVQSKLRPNWFIHDCARSTTQRRALKPASCWMALPLPLWGRPCALKPNAFKMVSPRYRRCLHPGISLSVALWLVVAMWRSDVRPSRGPVSCPFSHQTNRDAIFLGQQAAFDAGHAPVGGMRLGFFPPSGAFVIASSSASQSHAILQRSSIRWTPTCQSGRNMPASTQA